METVKIEYTLADGITVCVTVTVEVRDLLEQTDRQMRSQKRQDRRRISAYIDGVSELAVVFPQDGMDEIVERMARTQQLYAAMETLTETQRRRVYLHFFRGLSYRKIAGLEGVNNKSVAESVNQAVKKLRKEIEA
jgi:DNA-directed RNA polymerase specialized sigma subunit, sigma24 homolog